MTTTVSSFIAQPIRYREPRRDQRLLLPRFRVVIDGFVMSSLNWSLGGLLLEGAGPGGLAAGMPVSGLIAGNSRRGHICMSFTARVSRLMPKPLGVALAFAGTDGPIVEFLEDCLLARLSRHGGQ